MGHQVTIEGTSTPSVDLPKGERRTVEVTSYIRTLVRIGAVVVVEGSLTPPAPTPQPEPESDDDTSDDTADEDSTEDQPSALHAGEDLQPPGDDATAKEWLAFLRAKNIEVPVNKGRTPGLAGLKSIWQQVSGGS